MGSQTFRQYVESGGFDTTIYNSWKKDVESAKKSYNSYLKNSSAVYDTSHNVKLKLYQDLLYRGNKMKEMISAGAIKGITTADVDNTISEIGNMQSGVKKVAEFYKSFGSADSFYNWSYNKKYNGKSVSEVDSLIDTLSNSRRFLNQSGNQKELEWLKANRDTFMSKDELLSEIGSLESKSSKLKADKWKSGLEYAGMSLAGQNADSYYSKLSNSKDAEAENNARLKKLKELLAGKSDFDAESAYKKADEKNLFDVLKSDYTYADYLNDKDSKNIYGNAVIRQRDDENNKIIESKKDEFSKDFSSVANIIINKKTAADVSSSAVGGLLSSFFNDDAREDEILKTDPEIQKIIKKWSDMGYDFESLYKSYKKKENADFTQHQRETAAEQTEKNPVISNITSVSTNLIGGISALPSAIRTGIKDATSDDIVTLNTNAPEWGLKNVTDSIRDTTSKLITEKNEGLKGQFLNFLYQTGMSIADMGAATAVSGMNSAAMQIVMGTNTAVDSIKSVTEKGGSVDEALLTGITSGIFEALFEKVSIDNLFRTATSDTGRKLMYNFFKGFLTEGSEELATDIANTLADVLLNGNNSEYNNKVYSYMAEGKSASGARSLAMVDTLKQYGLSFAGGALSGGVIAGAGGGINLANANNKYSKAGNEIINNGNVDSLMKLADNYTKNQIDEDVSYDIDAINRYQNRIENKDFSTNGRNQIQTAVSGRLSEFGITDSAIAGRVVDAYFRGTEFRKTGDTVADKYGARVLSELRSTQTEAGRENYNNEWAVPVVDKARAEAKTTASDKYRARDIGRLASDIQYAIENNTQKNVDAEIKKGIQRRAEEIGIDKSTSKTASEIIFNAFMGEKLTMSQNRILEKNSKVKRIYNELKSADEQGINEEYSNSWVDKVLDSAGVIRETENSQLRELMSATKNTAMSDGVTDSDISIDIINKPTESDNSSNISDYISNDSLNSTLPAVVNGIKDFNEFVSESRAEKMNYGVVKKYNRTEIDKSTSGQLAVLDAYGRKHGLSFIVVDSIGSDASQKANGAYIGENKVMVSLSAEGGALLPVAGHEVYHYIRKNNKIDAETMRKFVISTLNNKEDYNYKERFDELSKIYGTEDVDTIEEEMVANSMFSLLSDEKIVSDLSKNNPTLLDKIVTGIKEFIAEIRNMIHSLPWNEAKALENDVTALETINAMAETAMWGIKEINEHREISSDYANKSTSSVSVKSEENVNTGKSELNTNTAETVDAGGKFSLSETDKKPTTSSKLEDKYASAVSVNDMSAAQKYVDKKASDAGYTIRAYHGTGRADRVGNVFLPERATSGPMAFFTSSKDIASNYARDKADTSLAYDEDYDDYFTQFRVNHNGESISISDYWNKLSFAEKQRIKEKAKHVTFDDEAENIIYDENVQYGTGGFDAYRLNSNKGNALSALTEEWLVDGQLYGEEHRFLDVLKYVGIDNAEYRDPDVRHEKVYDTYLKIENPFRTEDADSSFAEGFLEWYKNQDKAKYEVESASADEWDKNNRTAEEWVEEKLMPDIENGTSRAWTTIPDAVTDYLKSLGFDGIFDTGGKNGGESHTVYIPFSSEQIKSAEAVTYDDSGNVISLDERFNESENDIRFSFQKKKIENRTLKEYNIGRKKGSYYNEQETQFNIWQNSASTPVGAMKAFTRFDKKIHFYQKTENGCVEITKIEFDEQEVLKHEQDYESVERRIDVLSHKYETVRKGRGNKDYNVFGYSRNDARNDFGIEGERFQNEQSENLERSRGDSEETSEIKLSLQETASAGETRAQLLKENDNLRVANTVLKKELQLTKGKAISFDTAKAVASKLVKDYSSDYDKNQLSKEIYNIFSHYDKTGDYEYLMNYLGTVGKKVVARSSAVDTSLYDDYEDARKWIRNMRFTLPEKVLNQMNEEYDGHYVKKTFGRMQYVSREKHPDAPFLSQIYSELANEYPNFFSTEDNEYEQPMRLIEFWDKIQNTYYNPINEMGYASEDDAAVGFAFDVFDAYNKSDKLETFADKKKNEIEKLRKEYDRNLGKVKEKMNAERDKRLEWQKEYYINAREKSAEGRRKAYVKKKIRNVIKDLDKYLNKGSKDKNVKDDLQETVETALSTAEILFSDVPNNEEIVRAGVTSFTKKEGEWLDEYDALLNRKEEYLKEFSVIQNKEVTKDIIEKRENLNSLLDKTNKRLRYLDKCLNEVFEREKIRLENATVGEALSKLAVTYAKIKDSEHSYISKSYDENVHNKINELISGNKGAAKISLLSLSELDDVYDVYKMVLHTVRNANKIFTSEKKATAEELGQIAMEQVKEVGGSRKIRLQALEKAYSFGWNELKPVYAFRHIGSDVLKERYDAMRNGEDTYYRDVSHARDFYASLREKYKTDEWNLDKGYEFVSKDGDKFTLSLEQIMSIYAYCRRGEQAVHHLHRGGFVFSDAITVKERKKGVVLSYNVDDGSAYSLDEKILGQINHTLDDNQRAYVEEMQKYLSDVMGEKGNEISMELYGVKLFKEKNYFPLKSSAFYRVFDGKAEGEAALKNAGFSKATTPKATNPIVLDDFTNVWRNHVQDMAMYHSFVLPIEDFTKVFNYETHSSEDSRSVSLKAALQSAYGPSSEQYVRNLLKDLNSGVRALNGAEYVNSLSGLAKKGAVFASMSVVIQQPSAVVRATAYVNPKYFMNAFPKSANWLKVSKEYEELKKYAPVAGIKEMGYFDTGLGKSTAEWITEKEYRGFGKKFKAFVSKDGKYRDDVFSQLAGKADEVSWVYIWNAVKKEVSEKQHLSGEELLTAAGKRFTEVVELTQVYDSVFSRSGLMRSKDTGVKMLTSFMAEPTTQVNMLYDAIIEGKRGNKKHTAAVFGAVYASILANAMLKSIVTAGRDDDEEFSYAEKYVTNLISSFVSDGSIVSSIPLARDIISLIQGYDVERMDMTVIADVVNALRAIESDKKTTGEKIHGIATSLLSVFGFPAKNISKDVMAVFNTYKSIAEDYEFSASALKESLKRDIHGKKTPKEDLLYNAIVSGDKEYEKRLTEMYETESGYNTAIRAGLKKYDNRITDAAVARMNGNTAEYMKLAKEIIAEGNFSQDNIVSAIILTINSLSVAEDKPKEEKIESIFTDEDYFNAVVGGDGKTAEIVGKDLVETDVANGKIQGDAEKSLVSSLRNNVRDTFEAGELDFAVSKNILVKYGDMTDSEADNKLRYWDFVIEYPDITLDEEIVIKYYNEIESSGITVELFYDYYVKQKACKGEKDSDGKTISGSKKEQILKVIDALPLTDKQKDVLYFQNNWAESTLDEAPWH